MQIVLVSSPGPGPGPHWSQLLAADFARAAAQRGAAVRWLPALHPGQEAPACGPGVQVAPVRRRRSWWLHEAAAGAAASAMELAVTESLRAAPLSAVVHIGLGGQGTPNVCWLAERLGSRTYACARGAELVCHRSHLLATSERPCRGQDGVDACPWCCDGGQPTAPASIELRNREDLHVAALQTCAAVLVPAAVDAEVVRGLGVRAERVSEGASAAALAQVVLTTG